MVPPAITGYANIDFHQLFSMQRQTWDLVSADKTGQKWLILAPLPQVARQLRFLTAAFNMMADAAVSA